jgi:hypothetical protein
MISKIYNSNYILHKSGSRKNKSAADIAKEEQAIIKSYKLDKIKQSKINDRIHTAMCTQNLTNWEKEFLTSLKKFKKLSVKQLETLNNIILKYK